MVRLHRFVFLLIAALVLRGLPLVSVAVSAPATLSAAAGNFVDCHESANHSVQQANAHGHDAQACKITCDLGLSAALLPQVATAPAAVPGIRISIAPTLATGVILGPDHPPPIA
jgi:hypothetical protein